MIYMKDRDGRLRILVVDSANLQELRNGRPLVTDDKSVLVAWTPDLDYVGEAILKTSGGDVDAISQIIDAARTRPERPTQRGRGQREHVDLDAPPKGGGS